MKTSETKISLKPITTIQGNVRFSSANFSPDGKSIITTSDAGCERWNALSGEFVATLQPSDADYTTSCDFSSQSWDSLRRLTEAESDTYGFRGYDDYATNSQNGRFVALGSDTGYLHVVDLDSGVPLELVGHSTHANHMYQNAIVAMLFDPSSTYLISMADDDCKPLLWDLTARGEDYTWNSKPALRLKPSIYLNKVIPRGIDTIRFSPTEPRFVATHRCEETATIWEIIRKP